MLNCTVNNANSMEKAPWYSWTNRTKSQKIIIIIVTVLSVSLLFVCLLFYLMYDRIQVCTTSSCQHNSKDLSKYIDARANPCEDFYQFSCGNFLQNTNLDNRGSRSVLNIVEDEIQLEIRNMLERPTQPQDPMAFNLAKKFYRSCMNESAIEAEGFKNIKQVFRQMGGWPTLEGSNWRREEFDWKEAVYKLRGMGANFDFFFRVSVDRDKKDGSRYILGIHDNVYSPSELRSDVKAMYLDYMVNVALLFGVGASTARKDAEEVLGLLLKIAKISEESTALNKSDLYEVYSVLELHVKYRTIPWLHHLNKLLEPVGTVGLDDMVVIAEPLYMSRLEMLLEDTPKRTLANYIVWHTLQHLINYSPAKLLDTAYFFIEKVNGKITKPSRWKMCVKATEERMESVISTAYIKNYFDEVTQDRALDLIRNIKTQFKYNLYAMQWLDKKTKDVILKKLISTSEEIVSYDYLTEALEENRIYDKVQVHEGKLLESALNLDYVNTNIRFSKLMKPYRENWLKNCTFVTGIEIYYSPKDNIFRFPIGIFRGIFYRPDRPEYINYALLGSIIAHEISHVFMNMTNWWTPYSLLNYDEKLQCLAGQYGKFQVAELGKLLNPAKTRDEDMADLAAMKVSYDTYVKWVQDNGEESRLPGLNYSPNQLFWISSAIRHCSKYSTQTLEIHIANYPWSPAQYRVNGPLQNIEDFAFDFECPVGSKMNPETKCVIW